MSNSPPLRVRCRQIGDADIESVIGLLAKGFPDRDDAYWREALGQLTGRRPAEKVQEHCFCLIVGRVPSQHRGCTYLSSCLLEGRVARRARAGFEIRSRGDLHPSGKEFRSEPSGSAFDHETLISALGSQPVVDVNRDRMQTRVNREPEQGK